MSEVRTNHPELGFWYWADPPNPDDVYDGDTIKALRVDTGFGQSITIEGRLYGVNTPERWPLKTRAAALVARARLLDFVGKRFRIQTLPDDRPNRERAGKFGRWLIIVWASAIDQVTVRGEPFDAGLINVNRLLVTEGLGDAAFYGDKELW